MIKIVKSDSQCQIFQIGIPIFGDQPGNSYEAEVKGYGIDIHISDLTEEKLSNAIQEILSTDKFAKRAEEHGTLVMDQITNPLDRAVWWIEYAMRHKGKIEKHNQEKITCNTILKMPQFQE